MLCGAGPILAATLTDGLPELGKVDGKSSQTHNVHLFRNTAASRGQRAKVP